MSCSVLFYLSSPWLNVLEIYLLIICTYMRWSRINYGWIKPVFFLRENWESLIGFSVCVSAGYIMWKFDVKRHMIHSSYFFQVHSHIVAVIVNYTLSPLPCRQRVQWPSSPILVNLDVPFNSSVASHKSYDQKGFSFSSYYVLSTYSACEAQRRFHTK